MTDKFHPLYNPRKSSRYNPLESNVILLEEVMGIFKTLLSRLSSWEVIVHFFYFRGYSASETARQLSCASEDISTTRKKIKDKLQYLMSHPDNSDVRVRQSWW